MNSSSSKVGEFNDEWAGLSVGFNATFIDSVVTLPADEAATFDSPVIQAPMSERQMANAPEYLLNLFLNYDNEETGSQFGVYYTRQGTSLVAGATVENDNYIPNIFSVPYDAQRHLLPASWPLPHAEPGGTKFVESADQRGVPL